MQIFSVTTTIIVWLSISKFCSAGGDHGNSLNSVLSVLADISWLSVEKIKIFDDYEGLHKKIDLTQNTDLYFNAFLRSCKGDEGLPSTVEATLRNLTELIFLSSKISLDLSRLLDFESKSEKGDLEGYFGNLILKYIPSNPLEQIRDIVSVDSFSKSFSVGVYQRIKSTCGSNVSQLQHISIFAQYLKWIFVKTHRIAESVIKYFEGPDFKGQKPQAFKEFTSEYNIQSIIGLYYDTIRELRRNPTDISASLLNSEINNVVDGGMYNEIDLFRRMFLQTCYQPFVEYLNPNSKHLDCHEIKSAPRNCPKLSHKQICPVWMTCEKITCQSLVIDTTVCLDRSTGYRDYAYYIPTSFAPLRKCGDETYELRIDYQRKTEINLNNGLLDGKPATICDPCECVCEMKDRFAYYSTGMAVTNVSKNMVITGAKLEMIDNTIVISIQQGRLLPNGVIENKTEWLSPNVTTRERISLDELSPIDLTRVKIPHTDVMTGLKLTKARVGTDSAKPQYRIRLTALAHPYNFKEGFVGGLGIEYTADVGRSRVHQDDVISLFGRSPDSVIRDEYVDFIVSDGDDGGRRTLPLIDSREVVSDVLTPLSGAGLYLSRQHTGALVRLELLTYNLKPHFFYNTD